MKLNIFRKQNKIWRSKSYPFIYIHQLYINPIYIHFVIPGFQRVILFWPLSWFLHFKKLWKKHTCLFHPSRPRIKHRRVNLNWEEPIMNPMWWFFRSFYLILVHSSKYTLLKLMLWHHFVTIYKPRLVKVLPFTSLFPFTKKRCFQCFQHFQFFI